MKEFGICCYEPLRWYTRDGFCPDSHPDGYRDGYGDTVKIFAFNSNKYYICE
jgi:hypothetical protein